MRFGIAILRAVIGGLFIGHGFQKLTGSFGGHGLEGTAGFFESLGLHPGKHHATAAGVSEAGGGALMIAGAATPVAAAAITGVMTVATLKVHGPNGVWGQNGGYELPLVLTAGAFAVTASGPGPLAVDRRTWGTPWALAALAAGIGGGYAAIKYGESNAPAEAEGPAPEQAQESAPAI
jgi:putative oxidoreductase